MLKKIALTTIVPLIMAGCASVSMMPEEVSENHKRFESPEDGKAGLYVYRDSFIGKAMKKDIWVNGECLGRSAPDVFFYTEVDGDTKHTIHTESEFSPNSLEIFTESGKNYFIRQYIKVGLLVGGADLEEIEAEEATASISKLNMAEAGNCSRELNLNE